MPLYDWKCIDCGHTFEERAPANAVVFCPLCDDFADRQFTPNANITIPGHFGRDRGWHLSPGPRGPDSEVNSNSTVHSPRRQTFREKFDAAYKGG